MAAALVAAIAMAGTCHAVAAAHVPASDSEVIEQLPPSFLALRRLPAAPAPDGADLPLADALAAARRDIELGQTYADPRAYGRAQAALGRWWQADPAPVPLLVMRARILQFRHEFAAALAQLEPALRSDQFDPDAWLLFASIAQVQGNVRAARAACLKLIPMADPVVGAACAAGTAALSGRASDATRLLGDALQQPSAASTAERVWALSLLGDIHADAGDTAQADAAYRQALALAPDDVYAKAAYADLLLAQGDAAAARHVLGDAPDDADALLLRATIAAQRHGDADAEALRQRLAQRFAEAQARGDDVHLREQARFVLEVEGDAARALALARRNFERQREPADVRVLLQAAVASGDHGAAQPARQWLADTGFAAPDLRALAARTAPAP